MNSTQKISGLFSRKMLKTLGSASKGILVLTVIEKILLSAEAYFGLYILNAIMNFRFNLPLIFLGMGLLFVAYAGRKSLEAKSDAMAFTLEKEYLRNIGIRRVEVKDDPKAMEDADILIQKGLMKESPVAEHYRIFASSAERFVRLIFSVVTLLILLSWREIFKGLPFLLGAILAAVLVVELETRIDNRFRESLPKDRRNVKEYAGEVIDREIAGMERYTTMKCLVSLFKTAIALIFTLTYALVFPVEGMVHYLPFLYALYEFFLIIIGSGINGRDTGECNTEARMYFEFLGLEETDK